MAVAEGLYELDFKENHSVLFWADNNAESLAIVNGCLELGLPVIEAEVTSQQSLHEQLDTYRPSILVLQPDLALDSKEEPER